jgi:hypothetical protein
MLCRHRAEELGLALRPVTAVAPLDRSVLLMTSAAEGRIDHRPLLRTSAGAPGAASRRARSACATRPGRWRLGSVRSDAVLLDVHDPFRR